MSGNRGENLVELVVLKKTKWKQFHQRIITILDQYEIQKYVGLHSEETTYMSVQHKPRLAATVQISGMTTYLT